MAGLHQDLSLLDHRFHSDITSTTLYETPELDAATPRRRSLRQDLLDNDHTSQNAYNRRPGRATTNTEFHRTAQAILLLFPRYYRKHSVEIVTLLKYIVVRARAG